MGGLFSSSKTVQITTEKLPKHDERSEQLINCQSQVAEGASEGSSNTKTDTSSNQTASKDPTRLTEPDNETNKGQITLIASDSTMATYQAKLAEVDAVLEKYQDILTEGDTKEKRDEEEDAKAVDNDDDKKTKQDQHITASQAQKDHVTHYDDNMPYEILGKNVAGKYDANVQLCDGQMENKAREGHLKDEQMGDNKKGDKGIDDIEKMKQMKPNEPVDEFEKEKQEEEELIAAVIQGRRKSSLKDYMMNSEDGSLIDLEQESVAQKTSPNQEALASTTDIKTDFSNLVITTSGGAVD